MSPAVSYSYNTYTTETIKPKKEVIRTQFPAHENLRKTRTVHLNRILGICLGLSIFVSMICYSAVVAQESQITNIHKEISDMNYENIELENKLENIKSYYAVDNKVSKANMLNKPEKVLEVQRIESTAQIPPYKQELKINSNIGY